MSKQSFTRSLVAALVVTAGLAGWMATPAQATLLLDLSTSNTQVGQTAGGTITGAGTYTMYLWVELTGTGTDFTQDSLNYNFDNIVSSFSGTVLSGTSGAITAVNLAPEFKGTGYQLGGQTTGGFGLAKLGNSAFTSWGDNTNTGTPPTTGISAQTTTPLNSPSGTPGSGTNGYQAGTNTWAFYIGSVTFTVNGVASGQTGTLSYNVASPTWTGTSFRKDAWTEDGGAQKTYSSGTAVTVGSAVTFTLAGPQGANTTLQLSSTSATLRAMQNGNQTGTDTLSETSSLGAANYITALTGDASVSPSTGSVPSGGSLPLTLKWANYTTTGLKNGTVKITDTTNSSDPFNTSGNVITMTGAVVAQRSVTADSSVVSLGRVLSGTAVNLLSSSVTFTSSGDHNNFTDVNVAGLGLVNGAISSQAATITGNAGGTVTTANGSFASLAVTTAEAAAVGDTVPYSNIALTYTAIPLTPRTVIADSSGVVNIGRIMSGTPVSSVTETVHFTSNQDFAHYTSVYVQGVGLVSSQITSQAASISGNAGGTIASATGAFANLAVTTAEAASAKDTTAYAPITLTYSAAPVTQRVVAADSSNVDLGRVMSGTQVNSLSGQFSFTSTGAHTAVTDMNVAGLGLVNGPISGQPLSVTGNTGGSITTGSGAFANLAVTTAEPSSTGDTNPYAPIALTYSATPLTQRSVTVDAGGVVNLGRVMSGTQVNSLSGLAAFTSAGSHTAVTDVTVDGLGLVNGPIASQPLSVTGNAGGAVTSGSGAFATMNVTSAEAAAVGDKAAYAPISLTYSAAALAPRVVDTPATISLGNCLLNAPVNANVVFNSSGADNSFTRVYVAQNAPVTVGDLSLAADNGNYLDGTKALNRALAGALTTETTGNTFAALAPVTTAEAASVGDTNSYAPVTVSYSVGTVGLAAAPDTQFHQQNLQATLPADGSNLAGLQSRVTTPSADGTTATILYGATLEPNLTVQMDWRQHTTSEKYVDNLVSDVLNLSTADGSAMSSKYVLQMTFNPAEYNVGGGNTALTQELAQNGKIFLAYFDGTNWVNVVNGNIGNDPTAPTNVQGLFDGSVNELKMGAWGVNVDPTNPANDVVWAVLDHSNAQFAVVPEPATMAFLMLGGLAMTGAGVLRRRRAIK